MKKHSIKLSTNSIITTKDKKESEAFFKDKSLSQVSEENKQNCKLPITLKEISSALKGLQNAKSPGSNGFKTAFYKKSWPLIKDTVLESLTYASKNCKLSIDQSRGIINLIPQKR